MTDMATDLAMRRLDDDKRREQELEMAEQVHRLRVAGYSYSKIAKQLGFGTQRASDLHRSHLERLQQLNDLGSAKASEQLLNDRYEELLSTVWQRAITGDLNAVRECRLILDSISARTDKVYAMFTKTSDDGTLTLVARGSSEEYIKALKELG